MGEKWINFYYFFRQLRDVVTNVFTDQAILSYVQTLVKTWWPGGLLLPSAVERSAVEKEHSKYSVMKK